MTQRILLTSHGSVVTASWSYIIIASFPGRFEGAWAPLLTDYTTRYSYVDTYRVDPMRVNTFCVGVRPSLVVMQSPRYDAPISANDDWPVGAA